MKLPVLSKEPVLRLLGRWVGWGGAGWGNESAGRLLGKRVAA